jgi:hypothetical protein
MIDVWTEKGIETYVNDEPGDPNPGIIIDCRDNHGRALTSRQARALARDLLDRAEYFDSLDTTIQAVREAAQEAQNAALGDSNDKEINLLRDALEAALNALGLQLPDPEDHHEGSTT